jgi:hypothetical protein
MNKFLRHAILAVLIIILPVFLNHSYATEDSLEYRLACINAGHTVAQNDITVARFRSLLRQLSQTFVEDQQQIADMSAYCQHELRKNGISESLLNIMEGMNQLFTVKVSNQKYVEYIAAYSLLRNKGQSHAEAIEGLQGILGIMGIR